MSTKKASNKDRNFSQADAPGRCAAALALLTASICMPATALAYIGPGAGLSIIGSLIAFLGAIVLAILGFLWYPMKRLMKSRRMRAERRAAAEGTAGVAERDTGEGEAQKV